MPRTSIHSSRVALVLTLTSAIAPSIGAQQSRPPVRQLGAALVTSDALGAVSAVRQLPGGRVLVNDPAKRRVLLLDSTLKQIAVVADTTAATRNAYGSRGGGLLAYRGDSTLFVDPASLSMLVIDPMGKVTRVMAAPRAQDVQFLLGGPLGNPGFDAKGRLVYRVLDFPGGQRRPEPGQPPAAPVLPDSSPIVRYDLLTRKLDTAAFVKVAAPRMSVTATENGGFTILPIMNPLPQVDDWAVLPDGTIAIVRKDYHVDFVSADGGTSSAPKIPFDWQRLTDSAKVAIIDSSKAAMERARASMATGGGDGQRIVIGGPGGPGGSGGDGPGPGGGAPIIMMRVGDGPAPPPRGAAPGGAPSAAAGGTATGDAFRTGMPQISFVPPSELPDYRPAFTTGSVRADAEGKLWVRVIPSKPVAGGPEYDVIDRRGTLVDRVALPAGTVIAGFGDGGVVYLGVRDAAGTHLVRARER
ncbi:MAG TPA: hypothetical protein VGP25_06845 [Gemmatimonadaceae bacterium]|nr:hypothetical protein [Gemmatimonadaceae bacterium]